MWKTLIVLWLYFRPGIGRTGAQMVSVGEIAQNARIEGTDEIFLQTKQRMNQVEQDYKKVR